MKSKNTLAIAGFIAISACAPSFAMQFLVSLPKKAKGILASTIRPKVVSTTSKELILPTSGNPVLWSIAINKQNNEVISNESYQLPYGYSDAQDMPFLTYLKVSLRKFCLTN